MIRIPDRNTHFPANGLVRFGGLPREDQETRRHRQGKLPAGNSGHTTAVLTYRASRCPRCPNISSQSLRAARSAPRLAASSCSTRSKAHLCCCRGYAVSANPIGLSRAVNHGSSRGGRVDPMSDAHHVAIAANSREAHRRACRSDLPAVKPARRASIVTPDAPIDLLLVGSDRPFFAAGLTAPLQNRDPALHGRFENHSSGYAAEAAFARDA
jgi:hypothetical protein